MEKRNKDNIRADRLSNNSAGSGGLGLGGGRGGHHAARLQRSSEEDLCSWSGFVFSDVLFLLFARGAAGFP